MPRFKSGNFVGLSTMKVDITDTSTLSSDYFSISEFNNTFGLGKNSLVINNAPKDLLVEILDSKGNVLYIERSNNFNEIQKVTTTIISAHVYKQNAEGLGSLCLIGTFNKRKVKYVTPVDINTSIINASRVRFYSTPVFEVAPLLVFSSKVNNADVNPKTVSGSFFSNAIYPNTNFLIDSQYYNKSYTNYQIISDDDNFVSGMNNFIVDFNIHSVKKFNSSIPQDVNITASSIIKNVINNSTLQLNTPLYYPADSNNKNYVADVVSGSYTISYSEYLYSEDYFTTASYISESVDLAGNFQYKQYSVAEITYKNLDTFSGTITGHRVYRKSLNIAGDYELIIDEKFSKKELLKIDRSSIKTFENLGYFYNQNYINLFWFTSSNATSLNYDTGSYIDAVKATGSFSDGEYFLVKLNTTEQQKNATYIPFNQIENNLQSGSAYDSNFIKLFGKNEYVLSFNCNLIEKNSADISSLEFYLTGSYINNIKEPGFNASFGVKLAELIIPANITTKNFINNLEFKYTPINNIIGTLVVVPKKIQSIIISKLSLQLSTIDGFSPQSYITKLLFPINQPNELFDIKAELYSEDTAVVYRDLRAIEQFDPSGSSSPPSFGSLTNISASNITITNDLFLENLDNWGTLAENDLVLGLDIATNKVGYYVTPNLTGSGGGSLTTGSTYPITSSWALNVISSSYALTTSFATSASWAPGGGGTSLITGSTYPITSSWAESSSVSLTSTSASYASTASYALNSLNSVQSQTASYLSTIDFNTSFMVMGV